MGLAKLSVHRGGKTSQSILGNSVGRKWKGVNEGVPLYPKIKPGFLEKLILELSLKGQVDRGQLGIHRFQGTGHTLELSGT